MDCRQAKFSDPILGHLIPDPTVFMMQTQLKNTGMKNRFQPVCLHFSTNEFEPLCYSMITCNFNYKEPIHMKSDLTISLNRLRLSVF